MPEGSKDATILIATSYQALNRAIRENDETKVTDCTVMILFAGFFVEATLNYIFEETKKIDELRKFPIKEDKSNGKNYPGMLDKLLWFDNYFDNQKKLTCWNALYKNDNKKNLFEKHPGFKELHDFRNDISHGKINDSAKSIDKAKTLRQQAKDLVDKLYKITSGSGYHVNRDWTYSNSLDQFEGNRTIKPSANCSS